MAAKGYAGTIKDTDIFYFGEAAGSDQIIAFDMSLDSHIFADSLTYSAEADSTDTVFNLSYGGEVKLIGVSYETFTGIEATLVVDGA